MKQFFFAPANVRKLIYHGFGIVGLILAALGLVNIENFESIVSQLSAVLAPLVTTLLAQMAARNVHSGSDSTVTVDDVLRAQTQALGDPVGKHAESSINSVEKYLEEVRGE